MAQTLANLRRLRQITAVIARHGLGHYIDKRRSKKPRDPHQVTDIPASARRFRAVLEELGPTFIKFGQVVSTRVDLLPPGFAQALKGLQDNCVAMPQHQVIEQVEKGLKNPVAILFANFSAEPIACASIAQVHVATTHEGVSVAVKVQRPDIRQTLLQDIDLLGLLAQLLEAMVEESGMIIPRGMVDEFAKALLLELDFAHEAQMMQRFWQNCQGKARTYVVPAVFLELSCETVLTMELVKGAHLLALGPQHDRQMIARNIVSAAFEQVFVDGLFHADPHPGNCLVLDDNRLVLLDFGSVGQVSYAMRETLVALAVSVGVRDATGVAHLLCRVGIAQSRVSLQALRDACAALFDEYLHDHHTLAHIHAGELLQRMFDMATRFNIQIPSEYALVMRAAVTIEGIIRQLDPEFTVLEMSKPMLWRLLEQRLLTLPDLGDSAIKNIFRLRSITRDLPLSAAQILLDLEHGRLHLEIDSPQLETVARNIEALGLVGFMGMVAGGLVAGSLFILGRYEWVIWGLPVVPIVALYVASMLFGAALGRYLIAPRMHKISLSKWLSQRKRQAPQAVE